MKAIWPIIVIFCFFAWNHGLLWAVAIAGIIYAAATWYGSSPPDVPPADEERVQLYSPTTPKTPMEPSSREPKP